MNKKRFPSIVIGIIYLPFCVLLAWVAGSGIVGTFINCLLAFLFGFLLAILSGLVYKSTSKKNGIPQDAIELVMLKSALYIIPFIILAFISRAFLGWSTMMPFIATGTMSYIASTTMEMNKVGMKRILSSMIPSMIGSGITMVWTMIF